MPEQARKELFSFGFTKLDEDGKTRIEQILSHLLGLPPSRQNSSPDNRDAPPSAATPDSRFP